MSSASIVAAPALTAGRHSQSGLSGHETFPAVFVYFAVAGMGSVMLGPALPLLAARWKMPDAQLGTLFFTYFAGQFLGAWLATPRLRASLLLGSIASAAGLVVLGYAGSTIAHFALFCVGLGLGAGLTAGNVLVGTIDARDAAIPGYGTSRSRLLTLLNVSWGVGAIACPLLLQATLRLHRFHPASGRPFFLALAAALAACAVVFALVLRPIPGRSDKEPANTPTIPWKIYALFGATLVLYVGVENALGGWLPTYAQRLMPISSSLKSLDGRAAAIALCFWISELFSRCLTVFFLHQVRERLFYRLCLSALLATAVGLALVPRMNTTTIFALTAIAAIAMAPIFPLAVSFLLEQTGNHPLIGKVFASASLGGTLLPWLTGILSTRAHTLRMGLAVPAAGAALLLLLSMYLPLCNYPRAEAG